MSLQDIKLRILTNALVSTKGSKLTKQELDQNIIELATAVNTLNANGASSITPYNAGTTYIGGQLYYVSYNGNIYKFISATSQINKTPTLNPTIWELSSAGAISHQQGTDQTLDLNGNYQISAETLVNYINRYTSALKPCIDFANGLEASPSNEPNDIYIIQQGVTIQSTSITWQSGNTVRFQFAGSTDLSAYSSGMYLHVKNCSDSVNNGLFVITAVNDGSGFIEVANDLVTDATHDSTTSDCYVSNSAWGGVAQNDWVILDAVTGNWERVEPFDGIECFNKATGSKLTFQNGVWVSQITTGVKRYKALITQSGTDTGVYITSGLLEVGKTYTITNYKIGDDFTNVGASSNEVGISFCATGTTPTIWTETTELENIEGAPIVYILENTLDLNVTFFRNQAGDYYGIYNKTLPPETIIKINWQNANGDGDSDAILRNQITTSINRFDWLTGVIVGTLQGEQEGTILVEIEVYE